MANIEKDRKRDGPWTRHDKADKVMDKLEDVMDNKNK